jgi:hypothetical protein
MRKSYIYVQDWGTYNLDTLVCIGTTHEQTKNWIDKNAGKGFREAFYKGVDSHKEILEGGASGFVWYEDGYTILWLNDWVNKWHYHDTLMHECLHLIQFGLIEARGFEGENEAQAYQLEYLVRNIRTNLNLHYDKKAKK